MKARGSTLVLSLALGLAVAAVSPALAAGSAPVIDGESMLHLTPTDATLGAQINPRSTERGAYYQFQIVTDPTEFRGEFTCPTEGWPAGSSLCLTIPSQAGALPIGWIASGTADKAVSLDLNSAGMNLQPNTTYHWRVITAGAVPTIDTIDWEDPIVHGASKAFTTPEEGSSPTIESESVSAVRPTNAILKAQIDPGGLETDYEFHLEYQCGVWPNEACPFYCIPGVPEWEECSAIVSVPLPEGQLPSSSEVESISLNLNEVGVTLHPNTKYRYWVEATNSAGKAESAKEFFTTPTSSPPLIENETVLNVSPTDATLEAVINPGGSETSYEFILLERWGCEETFPPCEPPIFELPLPEEQLPASNENQRIQLDLNSAGVTLAPGHNFYEFWVRAINSAGSAHGPAQTFTTPKEESGATEPPLHDGSPGSPQGEEAGPTPPPSSGGATQGSPKATPCRRTSRHHHAKHHRHHRAGIGKACSSA